VTPVTEAVCAFADLGRGTARRFVIAGVPVAVVRIDDDVYAIGDVCSHANVSLSEGEVWCDEKEIECPKHSSTFSLITGVPTTLPATQPVKVHRATVVDGSIVVELSDEHSEEGVRR
jgi:3-phenylpropionate/trans-cinnamate dioxygenase ferredoxin component